MAKMIVGEKQDINTFDFVGITEIKPEYVRVYESDAIDVKTVPLNIVGEDNRVFAEINGRRFKGERRRYSFAARSMVTVDDNDWENRFDPVFLADTGGDKISIDLEDSKETREEVRELIRSAYNFSNEERTQALIEVHNNRANYKEFLDSLEAAEFVLANVEKINGKKVRVTGNVSISENKGKIYRSYEVQSLSLVDEDWEERFKTSEVLYFDKSTWNVEKAKETGFVELNGWVSGYSSALKSVGYYPQTFMYDISRFIQAKKDLEQGKQADVNEKDAKLFQFLSKLLQVKDNSIYAIPIDVSIQRGSSLESAELSEFEQEMVDSGMANIEDYTGYGSFVNRLVIDKINTRKRVKNAGKDGFKNGRLEVASVDVFRKHTITSNASGSQEVSITKSEPIASKEEIDNTMSILDDAFEGMDI